MPSFRLVKTCTAMPEHGEFTVECPDVDGELVYEASPKGDGIFGSVSLAVPPPQEYDAACGLDGGRNAPAFGIPCGLLSLHDMINFVLGHFVSALKLLSQELRFAFERSGIAPDAPVSDEDLQRATGNLGYLARSCERLVLNNACNRAERTMNALRRHADKHEVLTYDGLRQHCQVLWEAIDDDIRYERFFHYANHRVERLMRLQAEWAATLSAFPSVEKEIEEGVDCYGLGHYTACVFHMMRVAEIGLRALARERQVSFPRHPLEWADWQNILDETEKRARAATQGMARGPIKDAMQAFYSGAVGQLHGFKDTYRNVVMHVRRDYDEVAALRAITQVRDFMNGLSARIGEKTRKALPVHRWS